MEVIAPTPQLIKRCPAPVPAGTTAERLVAAATTLLAQKELPGATHQQL